MLCASVTRARTTSTRPRAGWRRLHGAWALVSALQLGGCASAEPTVAGVERAARRLARAWERGDLGAVESLTVPGTGVRLDRAALADESGRAQLADALREVDGKELRALVFVAQHWPVEVAWTAKGWRFVEDPTDPFQATTPRGALRALVVASHLGRWDVLVSLAPRRYRIGLREDAVALAWTRGAQAEGLRAARDRVASHLDAPVLADDHEAVVDLGDGREARLEREGERWVIVDFQ
jgi:hypothetical protein